MKKQIMKLALNSRGSYSLGADCDGEVCTLGDLFLDVGDWILDWLEDPASYLSKRFKEKVTEETYYLNIISSNMVAVEKKNGLIEISDLLDKEEEYNFCIEEDKLKELLKIWKDLTSRKVKKILLTWDGVNIELKEDIS
jgi:CRISPR/Cas system CMR-associated protein Cmr3 (group 5 of RAMP superfamily)